VAVWAGVRVAVMLLRVWVMREDQYGFLEELMAPAVESYSTAVLKEVLLKEEGLAARVACRVFFSLAAV